MRHRGAENEILEFLFEGGLDPAAQDIDGKTFMHHGAIHGAFTRGLVELLQSRDIRDTETRDSTGKTPLDYAQEKAHQELPDDILLCSRFCRSFNSLPG
jgi:ankyrin repeat protein